MSLNTFSGYAVKVRKSERAQEHKRKECEGDFRFCICKARGEFEFLVGTFRFSLSRFPGKMNW